MSIKLYNYEDDKIDIKLVDEERKNNNMTLRKIEEKELLDIRKMRIDSLIKDCITSLNDIKFKIMDIEKNLEEIDRVINM